jgi:hypothetical protein
MDYQLAKIVLCRYTIAPGMKAIAPGKKLPDNRTCIHGLTVGTSRHWYFPTLGLTYRRDFPTLILILRLKHG